MELRVEEVGDEGQQQKQGGDQEGGRVEDEGELLALLLLLPGVAHSERDLQVYLRLSGGVELNSKEGGRWLLVTRCQQYLEVDQTEVRLVVDVSHRPLLLKVRVAGLEVSLLGNIFNFPSALPLCYLSELICLISHPDCHENVGGWTEELTRAVRIACQLETLNTDN